MHALEWHALPVASLPAIYKPHSSLPLRRPHECAVMFTRVPAGDERGRIAYVDFRTAADAARAIERLQRHVVC